MVIPGSKLQTSADYLARISHERHLRLLVAQAEQAEQGVRALVVDSSEDTEFRDKHERRMKVLWREILTIKQRKAGLRITEGDNRVELARCQKELERAKQLVSVDMRAWNDWIKAVESEMVTLCSQADLDDDSVRESVQHTESEIMALSRTETWAANNSQQQPGRPTRFHTLDHSSHMAIQGHEQPSPTTSMRRRLRATLRSTKHWHSDYKTTRFSEATFVANYFKQQSKRDPEMAVHIQKLVRRRIRPRLPRSRSDAKSLEDFCMDVTWEDIKESVADIMEDGEQSVTMALG